MAPWACVKWYEAALIGGATVGIYSILASREGGEGDGGGAGGAEQGQ
ncbi:MAG: hypothetical protein OXU37_03155 [Thaumarchaeota archaeon]|nr:hypothetical protein [Nitrososphaerota archaeon]